MNNKFLILLATLLATITLMAQSPEKMSYQAVIRNSNDVLVTNLQVGMQISILQGSVDGTVVYTENQTPTTNTNGLLSIEIGGEAGFSTIDWSNGVYFIKTETDPEGGTNYTITGISQLLSVPYALHAKTAESITGDIPEVDPVYSASPASSVTTGDVTNLENLSGINTGDQDLTNLTTNSSLEDSIAILRNEMPDVSGFLSTEGDPVYGASPAASVTTGDINHLANLSGVNTGDQDLTNLATLTALIDSIVNVKIALNDSITQLRSEIPEVSGFLSTETDPVWTVDSVNYSNITEMNTSGAAQLHFDNVTNRPTTLEGHGITDAMNTSHPADTITDANITTWNNKSDFDGDFSSLMNAPNIANSVDAKGIQLNTNDALSSIEVTNATGASMFKVDGSGNMTGDGSGLSNVRPKINYIGGNQQFQITANYGNYNAVRTVVLEVPSNGVCFAMASGYVDWESTGWDVLLSSILMDQDPNSSGAAVSEWYSYLNILTDYNCADSSDQYTSFSQSKCFNVTAGTHTFYLWANKYSSNSKTEVADVNLSVMFFPTGGTGSTPPVAPPSTEATEPQTGEAIDPHIDGVIGTFVPNTVSGN